MKLYQAFQLHRGVPLYGIQGVPHPVSCPVSSIMKLYQALYQELSGFWGRRAQEGFRVQVGANFRLPRGELVPFPVQCRVE